MRPPPFYKQTFAFNHFDPPLTILCSRAPYKVSDSFFHLIASGLERCAKFAVPENARVVIGGWYDPS